MSELFPHRPAWRRVAKRKLDPTLKQVWRLVLPRELRRLHDALAETPLAGRYWVWGGLVLGWARERRILPWDTRDVDFAFLADDREAFEAAVPALAAAGFPLTREFRGRDGTVAEYRLTRRLIDYEFFVMHPRGSRCRCSVFGWDAEWQSDVELVCELPHQDLEPFDFLGRTWLKAADHEAELEAMYGDWRVPDPDWDYTEELSIVERRRL